MAGFFFFNLIILPLIIYGFSSSIFKSKSSNSALRSSFSPRTPTTMMANKSFSVGIVGATGAVGEEILSVMETRGFPVSSLRLFASEKSSGKVINSKSYGDIKLEAFNFEVASKLDVVLLAVGGDFSLEWAEKLCDAGN